MSDKKDLSKLSIEELKIELQENKKLFYPSLFIFIIALVLGIYVATHGGMGFFKIVLFFAVCMICLKYITQYSNIQKEIKARNRNRS